MSIIAQSYTEHSSGDAAWLVPSVTVCGYPYATEEQAQRFRHIEGCPRAEKPFIRMVLGEMGAEYACHGCKRIWAILDDWGDNWDEVQELMMAENWWGWRHAAALEVAQSNDMPPVLVRDNDRGLAHWLYPGGGHRCGRFTMFMPRTLPDHHVEVIRECKRCAKRGLT